MENVTGSETLEYNKLPRIIAAAAQPPVLNRTAGRPLKSQASLKIFSDSAAMLELMGWVCCRLRHWWLANLYIREEV